MDAYGRISCKAALDKYGRVVGKSIEYMRSRPLNSIRVDDAPRDIITLVTEVAMNSGSLTFRQDLEDKVIRTTRVIELTEFVLANFEDVLNQARIYGAVDVSQYRYHYCRNVWKAFLELWSPLTNTLHHGNGEMSISLWDLKVLGGLPISGIPYEEFIPGNKRLQRDGLYPATLKFTETKGLVEGSLQRIRTNLD
ncbi:hypothetical protein ACLB2K_052706 [Fragaria x ananassa]